MIHVERFDDQTADMDDAAKLRLLASYFDVQDRVMGGGPPEIQQDLLRMADRMEDLKWIVTWLSGPQRDTWGDDPDWPRINQAIDNIRREGAIK